MIASYQLVYYTPNPMNGGKFPIAAVVRTRDERTLVRAPHTPGPDCLGGRNAAVAVRMILDDLAQARAAGAENVSPFVTVGELRRAPPGVDNVERWVQSHVLPQMPARDHTPRPLPPRRSAQGIAFFEANDVARCVQRSFEPAKGDGERWMPRRAANYLPKLTHWVPGKNRLLLMEPIVFRPQWRADVSLIRKNFGYYHFELGPDAADVRFVAYMLPGGSKSDRAAAQSTLAGAASTVVDVSVATRRRRFIADIQETYSSSQLV